jgi:Protein of unknown function (DUF1194)
VAATQGALPPQKIISSEAAMIRFVVLLTSFLFPFSASLIPATAGQMPGRDVRISEVNLITALDVSDSIMRHEEWVEFDGMAYALQSEAFLTALAAGRHGRIGFAAFAWSSDGKHHLIVPWTLIASQRDAQRVGQMVRAARDQHRFGDRMDRPGDDLRGGRRTDVSAAIAFAAHLAWTAPFVTQRTVINICGNGEDNVGQDPDEARDQALAEGLVINGLVVSDRSDVADYYREHVRGGPGSFVLTVDEPRDVAGAMLEKFLRDLIAARQPGRSFARWRS